MARRQAFAVPTNPRIIKAMKNNPSQATSEDIKDAQRRYVRAKKAYFNSGTPIMSDAEFDKLEIFLKRVTPDFAPLHTTGVTVGKKVEAKLAKPMPSLAKILHDDENALARWLATYAPDGIVNVAAKVDGSSVQIVYRDATPVRMYTRGDGTNGKDISYLIPYMRIPELRQAATGVRILRCEVVLRDAVWKAKWKALFDNPRNQVAGVLNRTDVHASLKDFDVIVLENQSSNASIEDGLLLLSPIVKHYADHRPPTKNALNPTGAELERNLRTFRRIAGYELDGLVLSSSATAERSASKPKHVVAWKFNPPDEAVDAEVIGLSWKVSRSGRLTPKALLKPVLCGGVMVRNVTLNNAKWAKDRGIGPGAIVQMIRSGGVIPKIIGVKRKAKMTAPPKSVIGTAKVAWDEKGTQLVIVREKGSATHDGMQRDALVRFLKGMEIEFAATGVAQKLIDAGIDSPVRLMAATIDDFRQLAGFGERSAQRLAESVDAVRSQRHFIGKVAAASGVFASGVGSRRFEQILEAHPRFFHTKLSPVEMMHKLAGVPRFPEVTAKNIVANYGKFKAFLDHTGLKITGKTDNDVAAIASLKGPLKGCAVTFTGYRDKDQEARVQALGGTVVPFGSKTTHLLVTDGGKASTKADKARAKGIRVLTFDQLVKEK